jgi:hypothetical protein
MSQNRYLGREISNLKLVSNKYWSFEMKFHFSLNLNKFFNDHIIYIGA